MYLTQWRRSWSTQTHALCFPNTLCGLHPANPNLVLTELDKPRNGEPSITNLIWISEWLIPLVIIYKLPLRFFIFNFLRIMVYTVITGFIELPYEHNLVPGVLITNPKKIPSIWKNEESVVCCVLHSPFVLFLDNYSQTSLWHPEH
jgi:hypothetical protein